MNNLNYKIGGRDTQIDILKGIGIFLMVFRHARGPYSDFVLLFHMALFFIASGYLYKRDNEYTKNNFIKFIKRKLKSLWWPFFACNTLFSLLNNVFIDLNIYTTNAEIKALANIEPQRIAVRFTSIDILKEIIKSCVMLSSTEMGGAFWFLRTMFITVVLYKVTDYVIAFVFSKTKKSCEKYKWILQGVLALVLLLCGWCLSINGISLRGISNVFTVYILFYIGNVFKFCSLMKKHTIKVEIIEVTISLVTLLWGYSNGYISISNNIIKNPLFFLAMSIAGWMLIYRLSGFIKNSDSHFFIACGKSSLWILVLHFLSFKIVSAIGIALLGLDWINLASFPIRFYNGYWWIAYSVVGIVIPIFIHRTYIRFRGTFQLKC